MPFEGYWVEVHVGDRLSRALGYDEQGYHTTSRGSRTACSFRKYAEAEEAVRAAREQWASMGARAGTGAVNYRMVILDPNGPPEPVYSGPRPTAWEKILGDDDDEQP